MDIEETDMGCWLRQGVPCSHEMASGSKIVNPIALGLERGDEVLVLSAACAVIVLAARRWPTQLAMDTPPA